MHIKLLCVSFDRSWNWFLGWPHFFAGLVYGIGAAHSVFVTGETPRCAADFFMNVGSTLLEIIICYRSFHLWLLLNYIVHL